MFGLKLARHVHLVARHEHGGMHSRMVLPIYWVVLNFKNLVKRARVVCWDFLK